MKLFKHWSKATACIICVMCALILMPQEAYAGTSKTNGRAHAAYFKKLKTLNKKRAFMDGGEYSFADLTGDGVDEMIVRWWPSIYTYRKGKVVKVHNGVVGSSSYAEFYKSKKVVLYTIPDHMGSNSSIYLKWNGKKFVEAATSYTPNKYAKQEGAKPYYHVKGKGRVSKATCVKYIKKLVKGAKAKKVSYKRRYV